MFRLLATLLLVTLAGCLADSAPAGPAVRPENAMVLEGVIQGNNLSAIEKALQDRKEGEVDLVINSPGGSVGTGFRFLSVLEDAKGRGIRVNCFVSGMAASMAFQILLHCDERHVLQRSFLLWHRARIMMGGMGGAPMTAPQLNVLGASLQSTDDLIFAEVVRYLGGRSMSEENLKYHFENETMHVGETLGNALPTAFESHDSIPGLFDALSNRKLPRSVESFSFLDAASNPGGTAPVQIPLRNDLNVFEFGEIIYIK